MNLSFANKHIVKTSDQQNISIYQYGNKKGQPILFIHGLGQSHRSWINQLESDYQKEFNLVAIDLRGHGSSSRPEDLKFYSSPEIWANDINSPQSLV